MFDTIMGLPVHPLVVHGVVVLLPLVALVTVVVSLRQRWRERLAWPVVVLNALVLGMTFVARQSGEALEARLAGKTPEKIHIGTITRFIRPETPSTVFARLATSRPSPEKATADKSPRQRNGCRAHMSELQN